MDSRFGSGSLVGARIGYRVWAVIGVLLLVVGLGGATAAGASGLSIGANSTVKLGDALLSLGCNDLHIEAAGTLQAQASTIRLAGNWDNDGSFDAGTGTVVFEDGCIPNLSSIAGSSSFFDLKITTSTGKTVELEAGATQTVLDSLMLMGAQGNLLVIRSSNTGSQGFLNLGPSGAQLIDYVDVADNRATGQALAAGAHSINSGNTTGWLFVSALTRQAPAMSASGLAGAVLLLLAVAWTALRRTSRE